MQLDEVLAALGALPAKERAELEKLALEGTAAHLFVPNIGPQTDAWFSEADETFYGGAAGGGKTALLCGLAIDEYQPALILRRQATQIKGIEDELARILGTRDGYNSQSHIWRLPSGGTIELGGVPHEDDKEKYQGRPHRLKGFDEITQFTESQYRYIIGWLRDAQGRRCRVVATGNPPTSAQGQWVVRYWAPWLDPSHPNPAKPGELRFFTTIDGEDVEVDKDYVGPKGERPRSRTFIRSMLEDNPDLMATGYASQLEGLAGGLRERLRYGSFDLETEDDPWQVIPTAWIKLAQARWTDRPPEGVPMTAIATDVAQGGIDKTQIQWRHDWWYSRFDSFKGSDTPDGPTVAGLIVSRMRDRCRAVVDAGGGYGGDTLTQLAHADIDCFGFKGGSGSASRTREGLADYDPTGVNADAFNSANQRFMPPGTGAIPTSVWTWIKQTAMSVTNFDTPLDGSADAAPGVNRAIQAAVAEGVGEVHLPAGLYSIRSSITPLTGVNIIGKGADTLLRLDANIGGTIRSQGTRVEGQDNFLASDALRGATEVTLASGKGANFAYGDVVLLCSEGSYSASVNQKLGEIIRVMSVVGDTVGFEIPIGQNYRTLDSAQLQKIDTVKNFSVQRLTFTNSDVDNFKMNAMGFLYSERFAIHDVHGFNHCRALLVPVGSIDGLIDNCSAKDFKSVSTASGSQDGPADWLGYLINENGANRSLRVHGCLGDRIRNVYTCDTSGVIPYGLPKGTRVSDSVARQMRSSGFSTHEEGEDIGFIGCGVSGGREQGFLLRGRRCFVQGGSVEDVLRCAVWIERDSDSCSVQGLRSRNTGFVNDPWNNKDWREEGAIFIDSPSGQAIGNIIHDCGGPGITFGENALSGVALSNTIINPGQRVTANRFGIGSLATTSTTLTIMGNVAIRGSGTMDFGVRVASTNQNPTVTNNRSIGHTVAAMSIPDSADIIDNGIPNRIAFGAAQSKTLVGGALDVTGLSGGSVINVRSEVAGTADDLTSVTGGPNGLLIGLRRGPGTEPITLVHSATLLLKGGVNAA